MPIAVIGVIGVLPREPRSDAIVRPFAGNFASPSRTWLSRRYRRLFPAASKDAELLVLPQEVAVLRRRAVQQARNLLMVCRAKILRMV